MSLRFPRISARWIWSLVLLLAVAAAWMLRAQWWPTVRAWTSGTSVADPADAHDEHEASDSLVLSQQARRNLGLKTGEISLGEYQRTITIPAMAIERPGRTNIKVAAPLTGIVTGVYVLEEEAVEPGRLLFELRLTHADLVNAQTEFLRTLGQRDVERREIERLEKIASGAIAGKTLLERQYELEKLEAELSAQREALLLHGLSQQQVDEIAQTGKLVRELRVYAPELHADSTLHSAVEESHADRPVIQSREVLNGGDSHTQNVPLIIENLSVQTGEAVTAGQTMCTLADFRTLHIEGLAFEQDADELVEAANEQREVSAVPEESSRDREIIGGLSIEHVANIVDRDSRALHFHTELPNTIVRDVQNEGRHFITWRFKPGQRMHLRVPVETWENAIVLPSEAVAEDGLETYVFVQDGNRFVRRPVHVTYRDQLNAVIAYDGSLFPGTTVALTGAHQLNVALKNQAGGGVDPHAGHQH